MKAYIQTEAMIWRVQNNMSWYPVSVRQRTFGKFVTVIELMPVYQFGVSCLIILLPRGQDAGNQTSM
jgi:hypothetical protein